MKWRSAGAGQLEVIQNNGCDGKKHEIESRTAHDIAPSAANNSIGSTKSWTRSSRRDSWRNSVDMDSL